MLDKRGWNYVAFRFYQWQGCTIQFKRAQSTTKCAMVISSRHIDLIRFIQDHRLFRYHWRIIMMIFLWERIKISALQTRNTTYRGVWTALICRWSRPLIACGPDITAWSLSLKALYFHCSSSCLTSHQRRNLRLNFAFFLRSLKTLEEIPLKLRHRRNIKIVSNPGRDAGICLKKRPNPEDYSDPTSLTRTIVSLVPQKVRALTEDFQ